MIDKEIDENENTEPISSNILSSPVTKEPLNKISENFEKKNENIDEMELLDIDDEFNTKIKQSLQTSSKVSVDSLNIEKGYKKQPKVIDTNMETANSWTMKPSWVDAATGKASSSVAFSSAAISVDSLNINRNTETFEEDSLLSTKVNEEKSSLPLKVSDEIEFKSTSKITGSLISVPAPNPDLTFMNESWDDSSDLDDKKNDNSLGPKPKVLELEDFEESGVADDGNYGSKKISFESSIATDNIKKNNRMRYDIDDEDYSISKSAKDFAKHAEQKLLKSLERDDIPSNKDISFSRDAKIEDISSKKVSIIEYDTL